MDPIKDILGVHATATRAAHSNIDKLLQQESRDSTESDKLNEIQARFDRGGFLIFLDCPRGLQFGFDLNQWTVDTQFMGLKMIPTGIWHFMSVTRGEHRFGSWLHFEPGQIHLIKWNSQTEQFEIQKDIPADMNPRELDARLAPYPEDQLSKWPPLVDFIGREILDRIFSDSKVPTAAGYAYTCESMMASNIPDELQHIKINQTDHTKPDAIIHWTNIELKHSFSENAIGSERTKYSIDKSWVLNQLTQTTPEKHLLAELQLSFLLLLLCYNAEGLEQYKRLVQLFAYSDEAHKTPRFLSFFCDILRVIRCQVQVMGPLDEFLSDSFFRQCVRHWILAFLFRLEDTSAPHIKQLQRELKLLDSTIETKLEWKLMDEARALFHQEESLDDDEDGPTVVEWDDSMADYV